MRINTNISAIVTNNQLARSQSRLETSLGRLSSGYRINHASDDPAGMAISDKMKAQLRGLDQASNNASDGVSVIQTAEGAITEIQSMLTRMKELAVQAANDVNSVDERSAIQSEIDALNSEIDRISNDTEFNTQSLINGNLARRTYSDVRGVNQLECSSNITEGIYGITVTQDARQAIVVGNTTSAAGLVDGKVPASMAGTVTMNGYKVDVVEGDDINSIMTKLIDASDKIGGIVFAVDSNDVDTKAHPDTAGYTTVPDVTLGTSNIVFATNGYGSTEKLTVSCDNAELSNLLGITPPAGKDELIGEGLDAKAEFTKDGSGNRIGFENTAKISTKGTKITVQDINSKIFVMDVPGNVAGTAFDDTATVPTVTADAAIDIKQEVMDIGIMRVHVGANENQLVEIDIPEISTYTIGTQNINVLTGENAGKAISSVDDAIVKVSQIRAKLGAFQNRLDHTTANLEVSTENLTTALSTLIDTDMAEEMTNYTQQSVLAQAGTSMLSQANARPETVLQLLQK